MSAKKNRINDHFASKLEKAKEVPTKIVIEELMREYAEISEEHPKIFRLFWMDTSETKRRKAKDFDHLNESFVSLAKLIKIGMDKGEFTVSNERLAGAAVMSIINGPIILNQCKKLPKDITCPELLDQIIIAIFAYLEL